ncbi:hypothetical protein BN1232_06329 [Mycobacterium lentiflavum]|uniref:Uncharacterized protein n=2 Tax=Mycobacterium simiae complex TaxID=2249310 RepID=A0A0E3WEE4_MYCLN|nr:MULTISPECIES: hypothetical protein [Mycobacterium simiae complex]ORJ52700.1 hypothetical protein B5M45_30390 [Mycobacterium simiae]ULP45556.1 hypothetical protein MJO58_27840 [Mycobacterium lentiflavum]CQD24690.1 hypothetical protein BN1232_06329 [Mycobacterium lentiflavum]
MFDSWERSAEFPTLFAVDRAVQVDVGRIFPVSGIRKDKLPLWVKACGLLLEPLMPARQIAWLRRSDGGWVAAVEMTATSANQQSKLTMNLWLPSHAVAPPRSDTGEDRERLGR